MLQAGYTEVQPLPSRSYSMSVPLDASRPGPSSSTPHQPMPRMIASNSMKVGFELKNFRKTWLGGSLSGGPAVSVRSDGAFGVCVLKANAYGQAGVRAPGAV